MLEKSITVAVITSVYNDIAHIKSAVNSVKCQTHHRCHHYIYDDGSNDGTRDYLRSVDNAESISIIFADENRGQSYGRNQAMARALSDGCDYIAFLDSDDWWDDTHIAESLANLGDHDVVYSRPRITHEYGFLITRPIGIPEPSMFIPRQLLHGNYIWISSVVARSSCFVHQQFDSELDSIEDWDMWIRLSQSGYRFTRSCQYTATYLVRVGNSQAAKGVTKRKLLSKKHQLLSECKLHLASGTDYLEDYINVDLYPLDGHPVDAQFDVAKLPYPDNSVDEIRAFHIIEHFEWNEGNRILAEWSRVLKPGGRLWLETPDFLASCAAFVSGDSNTRLNLLGHFFATPHIPGQTHKFLFEENQLRAQLQWAKFTQVNRIAPSSKYLQVPFYQARPEIFLCVEAFKLAEIQDRTLDLNSLQRHDEHTFREIFVDNTYGVESHDIAYRTVIDLGANLGLFSLLCWQLSAKKIISVEAQSYIFHQGLAVVTQGFDDIFRLNLAISDKDGETVYIENNHVCSQVGSGGDPVQTVTIATLLEQNQIFDYDMVLKIDTEGAEFPALLNCDTATLRRFAVIFCELHTDYHNSPEWRNPEVVRNRLRSAGFVCIKTTSTVFYDRPLYTEKWIQLNLPAVIDVS